MDKVKGALIFIVLCSSRMCFIVCIVCLYVSIAAILCLPVVVCLCNVLYVLFYLSQGRQMDIGL